MVFLFWCSLYLLYTAGLLIAVIVRDANRKEDTATFTTTSVNPQYIILLALSALFAVFSSGMYFTHLHLLSRNASTVEWHSIQNMREHERAVLSSAFPACECLGMGSRQTGGLLGVEENRYVDNPTEDLRLPKGYRGRKELRRRWDDEWGRIGKEGNLWWYVSISVLPAYRPQPLMRPFLYIVAFSNG